MTPEERLTQERYAETPYNDMSWEVIGRSGENEDFVPMEVPVLPLTMVLEDPMFRNYGGVESAGGGKRAHSLDGKVSSSVQEIVAPKADVVSLSPQELELQLTEAFTAGKEAGVAEAVAQNSEKVTQLEASLRSLLGDMKTQVQEIVQRHEQQALKLALDISNKIIHFAVEINPEYLLSLVKEALSHVGGARVKRVRVSPQDMEFIQVVGAAQQLKEYDGSWEFVPDPAIRTGCVVESTAGEIDFQLDRAWERVRDSVVRFAESA